jgi:glycine oxidase
MKDFLIIGNGLAGIFCSHFLLSQNKNIDVIANQSQNSTTVAAGLYNPVVLKRFTMAWNAHEQSHNLFEYYKNLENLLHQKIIYPLELLRLLTSVEEQNNWTIASDKLILKDYINPIVYTNTFKTINASFGFGAVKHTGFVDTKLLQVCFTKFLTELNYFKNETFIYENLIINDNTFIYNNIEYKNVIFCEGFGLKNNSYFNYLPLDGTKGELLTIRSKDLKLNKIINSSVFILPLGNDLYRVGATYNWNDKDTIATNEGKNEILTQLNNIINCEFEVVTHLAGVRPTVNDRKPLIGVHPTIKNMYVLNGLGTRGVMLAPYLSKILLNFIEKDIPIAPEIDIKRYQRLMKNV